MECFCKGEIAWTRVESGPMPENQDFGARGGFKASSSTMLEPVASAIASKAMYCKK